MNRWVTFNKYMMQGLQWMLLNIYWIIFLLLGLGVFGFFPATLTLVTILSENKYQQQNFMELFASFWRLYKENFIRSNLYGFMYIAIAFVIYWSTITALSNNLQILYPWIILLLIVYVAHLAYSFVFKATQSLKGLDKIIQPFLVMLTCPIETIGMVASTILWLIALDFFFVLVPLFSANIIVICWLILSKQAIAKIQQKQKQLEGN
ncbi:DUF624 domain-containing protein [Fundicoccus sp. Sow4_H7]|uniref:DUF624 domain-containing protein n=1 Tax=Fundicoccus sp. Sow4_H7 TaxID=3438784 RepID=UPI003F8E20B1